jgi:hypothetical protein
LHHSVIDDAIALNSAESQFIKAIDRLQCFFYMTARQDGVIEDGHLVFSLKMMTTSYGHFPALKPYHDILRDRYLLSIAERRGITMNVLKEQFS